MGLFDVFPFSLIGAFFGNWDAWTQKWEDRGKWFLAFITLLVGIWLLSFI